VPSRPDRRIVVIGDVMTDVVVRPVQDPRLGTDTSGRITTCGGGSAANTACWLSHLGYRATFVGRVGADPFGAEARDGLERCGVEARLTVDGSRATGMCVVLVGPDGERTMIPDPGANQVLSVDELPSDLFVPGDHLHLSGYSLLRPGSRTAALVALHRARSCAMTTSVDVASAGPIADAGAARFLSWLVDVDVVLANSDEAGVLSTALPDGVGLDALGADVVVKLGGGGARWSRDGVTASALADPVTVVDTTGAGDAFAAGFLPGFLESHEPEQALRAGVAAARLAVSQAGARPAVPAPIR
jgi:sugar/nucleoside kinase (ribokinase family)